MCCFPAKAGRERWREGAQQPIGELAKAGANEGAWSSSFCLAEGGPLAMTIVCMTFCRMYSAVCCSFLWVLCGIHESKYEVMFIFTTRLFI